MKKKCKVCGKNADSDYCFQHKPRKSITSQRRLVFKTSDEGKIAIAKAMQQKLFFQRIWNKRRHYSEVSGTYLGREPLSIYFHHILPKSKYPEAEFDEENIVLLTLDEHTDVENNMYKYDIINQRRELLLTKYTLK